MAKGHRQEIAAASLLSGAAGCADAIGYLDSGVFAANMTGNTVLGSIAIVQGDVVLAAERFSTLAAFLAGALMARLVLRWRAFSISWALGLECVLLVTAATVEPRTAIGLLVLSAAMGVQAAAMTRFAGAPLSTVVVTSTLARLGESAIDYAVKRFGSEPQSSPLEHAGLHVLSWASYAVGAAAALGLQTEAIQRVPSLLVVATVVATVALFLRYRP